MKNIIYFFLFSISLSACIGDDIIDDFVQPEIRIMNAPQSLAQGDSFQIEAVLFGNTGSIVANKIEFTTDDISVATIDDTGLLIGVAKGSVNVILSAVYEGENLSEETMVSVDELTIEAPVVKQGVVMTTSSYPLSGIFTIESTDTGILIEFDEGYVADTRLPGLYVYLTNNTNTNVNAFEIGRVTVFEGKHTYKVDGVGIQDYSHLLYFCKPFAVKVGDGAILD